MTGDFEAARLALPRARMVAGGGTMIGEERRASRQFKVKPGSVVFYVEGTGAIRDLSTDGVFVLDSEPLPVATKITFPVLLGNETVSLQGIVRRSVAGEGMGIQFAEMSREVRRRLLSHIASIS